MTMVKGAAQPGIMTVVQRRKKELLSGSYATSILSRAAVSRQAKDTLLQPCNKKAGGCIMMFCASCCFNLEFYLAQVSGSIPEGVSILFYCLFFYYFLTRLAGGS